MSRQVRLAVQVGDILRVSADVIALKYQGALSGATGRVANALGIREPEIRRALPSIGSLHLAPGRGRIGAAQAAFLHVVPIAAFSHDHIRQFSADLLRGLRDRAPDTRHLALTVHGVMFGMDLDRSFRAQLEGCEAAIRGAECPRALERITVVNQNADDVRELQQVLDAAVPGATIEKPPRYEPQDDSGRPEGTPSHFDIFISFKSEDEAYAYKVFEFLGSRGLRVFFSRESLPRLGSDEYHAQIDLAIEQARHMIVVTSSAANVMSQWVQYEWRLFLGERLAGRKTGNLIAAIAGDMRIADLPLGLRHREVIRCVPEELAKLVDYTREDVDRAGVPPVPPVPSRAPYRAGRSGLVTVSGLVVATEVMLGNASWTEARDYLQGCAIEGQHGWRLPTLDELSVIRRASLLSARSCYWSSEESGKDEAFYMHFDDGHVGAGPKSFGNGLSAVFVKRGDPQAE
jgi:hypothetical protein